MLRLVSLLGIIAFLALAWLLSHNRRLFPRRTVPGGNLALQFFFAFAVWVILG